MKSTTRRWLPVLFLLCCPWHVAAGSPQPREAIEEILVVGARLPRPVADVTGTVDVVSRQAIVEQVALGTDDVFRYLPGVSVSRSDTRFGATAFNIRGLSGNRVTTLLDGVPVADQFDIGAFANAGQDYLIPDSVSRIEVLRGPASTLFGSDALGGVVAVLTRDPEEYLRGADLAADVSAAYSGADDARVVNAAAAGRRGKLAGVVHGSRLDGHQRDASGTSEEEPLERSREAAMIKATYTFDDGNTLRLKADVFDESVGSRPESVLGYGRQFADTTALEGDDRRRREAVQGEYDFAVDRAWAERARVQLYAQRSRTEQITRERRESVDPPVAIHRSFHYRFEDLGATVDVDSRFSLAGLRHRLGWGASLRRTRVEERRDGLRTNLLTGETTNVLLGEVLPVRDFPNSTVDEIAVYLHDEVEIGDFTLIPGVRFEHYQLDAEADAVYREDYPDLPVEDVEETAVVPKLGLQWAFAPASEAFVQYSRGFRAPPFEDVNIGLQYAVPFNVRAIPNPDLESETSDGIELGVRHRGERVRVSAALFGADYDDFIESKVSLGFDPQSGALLFQSRNVEQARIYGAELSVSVMLAPELELDGAVSWIRGENRVTDEPLNSVDPASATARLRWTPAPRWSAALAVRAAAGKERVDDTEADLFEPDGYAVFDLMAGYSPTPRVRLHAGVFNVTDRTYLRWPAVRGRPEGDPLIERLAAPGRYGAVSVHVAL